MQSLKVQVESLCIGIANSEFGKSLVDCLECELDGIVGDKHRGISREAWETGDKQLGGTIRRNERHWSAVSMEELATISKTMNLAEPLTADLLGTNLCFKGQDKLSQLPKGSVFKFPSGAELIVEEYNPPCPDMGEHLAQNLKSNSEVSLSKSAFPEAAKFSRGLVGVVEVPGIVNVGDEVTVISYKPAPWLAKMPTG